jgi:hypothetical protein
MIGQLQMKYFLVTPVGFGAISHNQIFHAIFPESIIKLKLHINALDCSKISMTTTNYIGRKNRA